MEKYNEKIAKLLRAGSISPGLLGYKYIAEAVKMAIQDESVTDAMTKVLYPQIAKKFNSTPSRVERAIRHSVETSFFNMPPEVQSAVFGSTSYMKGKVTNTAFIATLTEVIIHEPNNPVWSM